MVKYLDYAGLSYLWLQFKTLFVMKEAGKGLSTNDFTNEYKDTLDNLSDTLSNKKDVQNAVNDPSADGNEVEFISGISQNAQGVISPLKKTVRSASTAQSGIVQLSNSTTSTDEDKAATPAAVKEVKDAVDAAAAVAADAIPNTEKGANNGVAPLNASGTIDAQYLPSYVDDVLEVYPVSGKDELASDWFASDAEGTQPVIGETGKIYVLMSNSTTYGANTQFRWGGSSYIKMNDGGVSSITTAEIDTILAS